jgi:hypothetical protein
MAEEDVTAAGAAEATTSSDPAARRSTLRASHADRDQVVEALRVAAGDGRLSAEELDERLELALNARTYAELASLTADLPAAAGADYPGVGLVPAAGTGLAAVQPKEVARIQVGSGHAQREGRWVVPRRIEVQVTSGHVRLDFTQAVITSPVVEIVAEVRSGHLLMLTRPGIAVDAGEVAVRSGHVTVREPWGHGVPAELRVNVTGTCRSGHITARPRRRSLWQWLRRAPRPYEIAR